MDSRYVRGRQFNLALLATACAQGGDIERASVVGLEAADLAVGLRSARSIDYLRDLANRLAPHVGLTAVQEFTERVGPLIAA
jgi:hypothetical protein